MKAFFIIFLYFLFDRETYYILHSDTLSLIYVSLSKFFAVFVILMALIKQFNKNTLKVMVVDGFLNSPIIGNGVRETTSLFYISEQYTKGYMSAHNQILQSLYETGILFFVSLVPLFNELNKSLKSSVPFFSLIVKGSIFSFLVMYMAEAPGMDKILNLVVFGLLVSKMNNTVTCKGNMYVRCEK